MQLVVYHVFYSQYSQQHVSGTIATIFWAMLLLQEYKRTNMISCVTLTPEQTKIITISVKIM